MCRMEGIYGRFGEWIHAICSIYLTGVNNYFLVDSLVTPSNPHNLYHIYSKFIELLAISWGRAWEFWALWVL